MIQVTTEPGRKLVRAVMRGMLTIDEVAAFDRDRRGAVRRMGLRSDEYLPLVHAQENTAQSQEVMDALQRLVTDSDLKAKRIATVRDGALTRMQARRIARLRDGYEVFDTVADAEAWLLSEPSATTAAR